MTSQGTISVVQQATQFQHKASDPMRSAWVSANAGSGKTYVLVNRIIRLMLEGTPPEKILCLTFTKAAAAEMSNRLFERLSEWVSYDDETLTLHIEKISGKKSIGSDREEARKLFARSLETPGGLKIQTIHGFCESLLHRFPLEAGISPGFKVLEETEASVIKEQARNIILARAMKDNKGTLAQAVRLIVTKVDGDRFDQILDHILRGREKLIQNADQSNLNEALGLLSSQTDHLKKLIQLENTDAKAILNTSFLASTHFDKGKLLSLYHCLKDGGKRDQLQAELLLNLLDEKDPIDRLRDFEGFFLTKSGIKKSASFYMSKKTQELNSDLAEWAFNLQQEYIDLQNQLKKIAFFEIHKALYLLADAIDATYRVLKKTSGSLDFDDLITHSSDLFKRIKGAWVLYKIDGGLDHILIDEAQDTSGAQWQIISAIAEEFFAGEGAADKERTLFAVGDEKQSIYSFQGAEPSQFDKMRNYFARQAQAGARQFEKVPLSVSFRSTAQVLGLVDEVFKNEAASSGLTHSGEFDRHTPTRLGQAGLVELWETIKPQDMEEPDPWDAPLDWQSPQSPAHQLANKIARKIRRWIDDKEILEARGRPIEPGDILILVRKRKSFFEAMLRALKAHDIPVAGADRMSLSEQIAVMDLLALGQFTLLPDDDLTLACVLKSPLFGLSEEELFELANEREGSLWRAVKEAAPETYEILKKWRNLSRRVTVFEFYSYVLNTSGGRKKIVGRLGEEANDPLDEFLSLALTYDQTNGLALQDFLYKFSRSDIIIKRDMEHGKNEVRLMTVHGAKGLEGNIVFLPETCSVPKSGATSLTSLGDESEVSLPVWGLSKREQFEGITHALSEDNNETMSEYRRLLYVALTRARDRLYLCGFEGARSRDDACWYNLVETAVLKNAEEKFDEDGSCIWRLEDKQTNTPQDNLVWADPHKAASALPTWVKKEIPQEEYPPRPLVPSRLVSADDEVTEQSDPSRASKQSILFPLSSYKKRKASPFKRGILIHNLLQYLPELSQAERREKAMDYLSRHALEFDDGTKNKMVEEVCAILEHQEFAKIFGPTSRAEVPVSALITEEETGGRSLAINGQIDRLLIEEDQILIIDYKTNRPPPKREEEIAPLYLRQMAAYRLILKKIYPKHQIKCALLWTYETHLMPLSDSLLEKTLKGVGST